MSVEDFGADCYYYIYYYIDCFVWKSANFFAKDKSYFFLTGAGLFVSSIDYYYFFIFILKKTFINFYNF